ncbi:hypothetical protein PQO01_05255 [Lentisphaera marina]|uniref:hypothetical protein n=1 Tax=Lentisphaera marina TaxID=1111041 RepID=UPI0023664CB8|nr:hypothetical protein [Lentisphaera marina]MDD7984353.1 hypothetical protein [Lentisphaera marina]
MKNLIFKTLYTLFFLAGFSSCGEHDNHRHTAATNCGTHDIAKVDRGFCDNSLLESKGFCKEHNIAEVMCPTCSPAIIPAYKKEGDWCKEHYTAKSLCVKCGDGK